MPMQFSVRVTDRGVYQGLRKLADGLPDLTGAEMWDFMQRVQYKASGGWNGGSYYADVPERGYPRTGNYGASFIVSSSGLTFRLSNATYRNGREYGKLVGGDGEGQGQAGIHVGWWPVIRFVMDEMVNSDLVQRVENVLRDAIRAAGIGM